jgi:superfamily II DNA or RNA helicase
MNQTGIYEQMITNLITGRLNKEQFYIGERVLEQAEAAIWLSRFLSRIIEYAVNCLPAGDDQLQRQIELSNQLILWLKDRVQEDEFFDENLLAGQGKILTALYEIENPVAADLKKYVEDIFPLTGLTQSELFCGSNAGLSLESELKREIKSSDKIYWLVSFIKWAGIRIFKNELEEFTRSGKQLKVITTSYMGATDAKAVEFLASLPNTEVKLSYNTQRERLHAKSYLFLRDTGFHTGYIGSSNLSHSALTSGLEWNLKITSQEIPHIIERSINTFETYWNSNEFEIFDGKVEAKEKLKTALKQARIGDGINEPSAHYFEIKPFTHQQEILEQLEVERSLHKRFKNLVVAATGTGKTLISAFDFARYLKQNPNAKFLFVAHREEILKQARLAYRGVLKNASFGELWVGNYKPERYEQMFASVQTLNNQLPDLNLSADYYDYVVIDEVHHVAASSYRSILARFEPQILLGLTATPERHDGSNILDDFCGVIAAEIRLPEAINRRHLCPFQYFGVDDDTDLRNISWNRGRYDIAQLTNLYTHNQQRVDKIYQTLNELITSISNMRALAFCVSKEHAEYMCKQFLLKGIKCDYLTSDNSQDRGPKQQALRSGEINILFVVDIFNEGVDIPEVDTLLFLRPTESLTIFLQQLGRGLRLADDKDVCTVLDFVGNANADYDFAHKFRALVGKTDGAISDEIKNGFPHAPLGCRIELSKQTQDVVLRNIRNATLSRQRLIGLAHSFSRDSTLEMNLANFIKVYPQVEIEALYKRLSWTELCLEAGLLNNADPELVRNFARMVKTRLLVCDDHEYLNNLQRFATKGSISSDSHQLMVHYDFWQQSGEKLGFQDINDSLNRLGHQWLKVELGSLTTLLIDRIHHKQETMPMMGNHPIKLHARYAREQILVGFGATTFEKQPNSREGVFNIKEQNIELLFVTLNKNEKQFSPTTMYHDYAINEDLFHWQSQNSARPERGKGLDYVTHKEKGKRLFLFVREQSKDEFGKTMGFVNFGEVDYVSHTGSQPMNITWKLRNTMPAFMWKQAAKLAMA